MANLGVTGDASFLTGDPVSPRPKVTIRPMHLTLWDESQITNVRKPIGYRWECTCGKYGRIRRKRPEAVAEGAEHRTTH